VGDPDESLRLLDEWERELDACYAGQPRHSVFVALRETITACDIPKQPFADLLHAFRQDQHITRYPTFDDLLGYCHYSANPVGRLVLYVCGYRDPERQQLSDFTCTALQLANFWQDVWPDYGKGRMYLPLEDLRNYGIAEQEIGWRHATPQFLAMMRFEVERAREWFSRGLPLASKVNRELAIDIGLFTSGGREILKAIERQGFDVLKSRPAISKGRKLMLVARAALGRVL
jgi:squalene synthase HpnC